MRKRLRDNIGIAIIIIIFIIGSVTGLFIGSEDYLFPGTEDYGFLHWLLIFIAVTIIPSIILPFTMFRQICREFIPVILLSLLFVTMSVSFCWLLYRIFDFHAGIIKGRADYPVMPVILSTIITLSLAYKYFNKH